MPNCEVKDGFLKFLTDDQVNKLHESTLKLLERTKVIIESNSLMKVFEGHGAVIDKERKVVKIPPNLVEESIESASKTITLQGRNGTDIIKLEGTKVWSHTLASMPMLIGARCTRESKGSIRS